MNESRRGNPLNAVGREQEHHRRGALHVRAHRARAEAVVPQLRQRGLIGAGDDAVEMHQHDQRDEHRYRQESTAVSTVRAT